MAKLTDKQAQFLIDNRTSLQRHDVDGKFGSYVFYAFLDGKRYHVNSLVSKLELTEETPKEDVLDAIKGALKTQEYQGKKVVI